MGGHCGAPAGCPSRRMTGLYAVTAHVPGTCECRCLGTPDPRTGRRQPARKLLSSVSNLPPNSSHSHVLPPEATSHQSHTTMMYRVTPLLQTSARRPSYCLWLRTSGATYFAEPTSDFGVECKTADCSATQRQCQGTMTHGCYRPAHSLFCLRCVCCCMIVPTFE